MKAPMNSVDHVSKPCFYMQQVLKIEFPSIPGFNINEATDILLKRDFDKYRGQSETHPFLIHISMEHLSTILSFLTLLFLQRYRMNTVHGPTHLLVGGGLDDVYFNTKTNQLHIVDYKSTSQKSYPKEITLEDPKHTNDKWTYMFG